LHIICHKFHLVEMASKHSLKLFIHKNVPTNNHVIQNKYSWNLQKKLDNKCHKISVASTMLLCFNLSVYFVYKQFPHNVFVHSPKFDVEIIIVENLTFSLSLYAF